MKQTGRKILCVWIAFCCGLIITSLCAQPIRVSCVGNSITEGYGLKKRAVESYPAVLQRILGDGYAVSNFGYSGRTLLNHGDRPYMKEDRYQKALESNPDIVTIKLGTNDTKPYNWKYKSEFVQDLKTMVAAFRALPSHPQVYLCLPVPPVVARWGISDSIVAGGVIPYIWQVAGEMQVPVIDLYTPLKPFPELFPDSIHPNRAGACIIAEEIARRLLLDAAKPSVGGCGLKPAASACSQHGGAEVLPQSDAVAPTDSSKVRFKRHSKTWK